MKFEAVYDVDSPSVQASEQKKVQELIREFEVSRNSLLESSYPELLAHKANSSEIVNETLPSLA